MRTHLTRSVIRSILANRPIPHRQSLVRTASQRPTSSRLCRDFRSSQCRGFTNLLPWTEQDQEQRKDRDPRPANFAPGIEKMVALSRALRLGIRPDPDDQLIKAFNSYWESKAPTAKSREEQRARDFEPARDFELHHVLHTFRYLRASENGFQTQKLTDDYFLKILKILCREVEGDCTLHAQLVELVHQWWTEWSSKSSLPNDKSYGQIVTETCLAYATQKDPARASQLFESNVARLQSKQIERVLLGILRGHQRKGSTDGPSHVEALMKTHLLPRTQSISAMTVIHYAAQGEIETALEQFYNLDAVKAGGWPEGPFIAAATRSLISNSWKFGKTSTTEALVRKLLSFPKLKAREMDEIIIWAAATGKSVEELDQMIDLTLARRAQTLRAGGWLDWDEVEVVNGLIDYAIFRQDPYLAERYLSIAHRRGMQLNGRTYLLQMKYRLLANDVRGARDVYNRLQAEEFDVQQDVPVLNQYIRMLIESLPDGCTMVELQSICDELAKRGPVFEPETVSQLSILHLEQGDLTDVIDLLQLNCPCFTVEERAAVRNTIHSFCVDMDKSIADVWDAYMIYREIFDEAPRTERTEIMWNFFRRGRPDLALHAFNHMLYHSLPTIYATKETYAEVLMGIVETRYKEGLEHVHNRLRLDARVDPDTKVYNALMLAYLETQQAWKAIDYWDDIARSREGPNQSSITIALRVCRDAPLGEPRGREIWAILQRNSIEITSRMMGYYIGNIASRGYIAEACREILSAEKKYGVSPDEFVLGCFLNASQKTLKWEEVQIWIQETFPKVWKEKMEDHLKIAAYKTIGERRVELLIMPLDDSISP